MSGRTIAAVDIGTTKISVITAEITEKGPRVIGTGLAPSRGIRKGLVINIEETAHSIRTALNEARKADPRVLTAVVGITGRHITGLMSSGVIGLHGREITAADRQRAIDSAKTVYIPLDREVLQIVPCEFMLDGQPGITDPVGMSGVRLEARVHILTADSHAVQNLRKACTQAGLDVLEMVFEPYAASNAVLAEEEIESGALLIDIGGGTTDMAFFRDGAPVFASVLGIGGLHITNDLAVGLELSIAEAEQIKKSGKPDLFSPSGRSSDYRAAAGRPEQLVTSIVQARCEELFEKVREEIAAFGPKDLSGCPAVITGGTAHLRGITGLASAVLQMPVRTGIPQGLAGLKQGLRSPENSAVIGLVNHAALRLKDSSLEKSGSGYSIACLSERIRATFGFRDLLDIFHKKKKGVSYV